MWVFCRRVAIVNTRVVQSTHQIIVNAPDVQIFAPAAGAAVTRTNQ